MNPSFHFRRALAAGFNGRSTLTSGNFPAFMPDANPTRSVQVTIGTTTKLVGCNDAKLQSVGRNR